MRSAQAQHFERLARLSNILLGAGGVFCALLFFYCIYYYGWTERRYFTSPSGIILYYVVPAAVACILFAALRLQPHQRITLSLFFVSTGASIYAANLFLALSDTTFAAANRTLWFRPSDVTAIVKAAKEFGIDFDTRNKFEVVDNLRRKGIDAVPSIIPLALLKIQPDGSRKSAITIDGIEVLPHGGISNRVTVYCNESGEYIIYESDEHGFHNPKGIWDQAPLDIIALGDSFTQGGCVPSDRNFVGQIRRHYPKTLNLGMAGQGPLISLATLKDNLQFLRPRVVLWFFYEGNDIADLRNEGRTPLLMRYLERNFEQALLHRQADIDKALAAHIETEKALFKQAERPKEMREIVKDATHLLQTLIKLSPLRQRLGLVYGHAYRANQYTDLEPSIKMEMDLLHNILREAKRSVDAAGGKLYFVYLPEREQYSDPTSAKDDHDRVLLIVKNIGLAVIDVLHAFQNEDDPLALFPFRRAGHYNERGHGLVAQEVLRSISVGNWNSRSHRCGPSAT
jgi:hypothetical protein